MPSTSKNPKSKPEPVATPTSGMPRAAIRAGLSVLFVIHLTGIFLAPLAASVMTAYRIFPDRQAIFTTAQAESDNNDEPAVRLPEPTQAATDPEASDEVPRASANLWVLDLLEPYLDIAYLNHGYNFFAPDPGPSLLIRYRIETADGQTREGIFPDLQTQWPRLRYHRHFMLSSHSLDVLPGTAPNAFAKHLLRVHQGRRVTLELLRHRLLSPQEVLAGKPLDDPDTYTVIGSVVEDATAEDSELPLRPVVKEPSP